VHVHHRVCAQVGRPEPAEVLQVQGALDGLHLAFVDGLLPALAVDPFLLQEALLEVTLVEVLFVGIDRRAALPRYRWTAAVTKARRSSSERQCAPRTWTSSSASSSAGAFASL
jgi:hypothetical protein